MKETGHGRKWKRGAHDGGNVDQSNDVLNPALAAQWDLAMEVATEPGPATRWLAAQTPVIEAWKREAE